MERTHDAIAPPRRTVRSPLFSRAKLSWRLDLYEHNDDLKRAISMVAALLGRAGLLVVVYGHSAMTAIRGGIVREFWRASPIKDSVPSKDRSNQHTLATRVRVERQIPNPVSFIAKLD